MSNDLTTIPESTATRSIVASLKGAIPSWISTAALDSCFPHGAGFSMPDGAGTDLREAAVAHDLALAPAKSEDRQKVLLGLRSATIVRRETEEEAGASLDMLRVHLEDVPLDILQASCRAYCNAPGQRFFPRSAGELRTFINPMLFERSGRSFRLKWLAERADEEEADRRRVAENPATAEELAELSALLRQREAERTTVADEPRVPTTSYSKSQPTIEDYKALGLDDEEALKAWDDHRRLMARPPLPGLAMSKVA